MSALVVRLAGERVSLRLHRRPLLVGVALALVALGGALLAIATGDYPLPLGDVIATLLGGGDAGSSFIVETLRLPRALTGLLVGGALGVAGAIFQSLTRNPLGSPDVIGFTYGAAAGAVVVILMLDGSSGQAAAGAVVSGFATAAVVYALSSRGGAHGYRLVVVGIAIGYALLSVIHFLITRARLDDAMEAARWLAGSLNGRGWEHVRLTALALALLLPVAFALGRRLHALEMGDDAAIALGVRVERSRLLLAAIGVALTAVAVAAAGPLAFVALMAPQIARQLCGGAAPGLATSGLTGAALLVLSDVVAQRILPTDLPAGIVTGLVGGCYLAWLLSREWRSR